MFWGGFEQRASVVRKIKIIQRSICNSVILKGKVVLKTPHQFGFFDCTKNKKWNPAGSYYITAILSIILVGIWLAGIQRMQGGGHRFLKGTLVGRKRVSLQEISLCKHSG